MNNQQTQSDDICIYRKSVYLLLVISLFIPQTNHSLFAQSPWDPFSYPDEAGFSTRMAPMLERIASQKFGIRSLAHSQCPDTGLPVKTWAIKGDSIISPYTGRKYIQGETGYFGPKARNKQGEIIAFGGDPLKYDLPPATATLLLHHVDQKAKAFLSIPGNLRQQYHFACKNWARFYPLLADKMTDQWRTNFHLWVSKYSEERRPSDGIREMLPLSRPHDLIGEKGQLLGGNTFDGGTENHKTMWRTSALLYSQLFPKESTISGYPIAKAESLTKEMISNYLKRILFVGNGEFDSEVYYPHSIESFLNLYDFSPDPATRQLAQLALDFYFATYGLKVMDGAEAGAMKRGYLPDAKPDDMEQMQWAYFNNTSRNMNEAVVSIQQATTTYRPNKIIYNISNKNIPLPFEAKMSRPFYHMDHPHAFAETFYCSENFALGNVQMTIVDNPNQQMVWSLLAKGKNDGALAFSGGQPLRGSTSGHSPYTQTLHSKGTLILFTAPTEKVKISDPIGSKETMTKRANLWHLPKTDQAKNYELVNRQKYGARPLHEVETPAVITPTSLDLFWEKSKGSASSWFFFPKSLTPKQVDGKYFLVANKTYLAITPLTKDHLIINPSPEVVNQLSSKAAKRFFNTYGLIVFLGQRSGYILEAAEHKDHASIEAYARAIEEKTELTTKNIDRGILSYQSLYGEQLTFEYQAKGLRCRASIDGQYQDWDNHTQGAVYVSPFIQIKDGIFKISDGKEGYQVDFTGSSPIWSHL